MTLPEAAYRDLLAAQVGGDIEVPVPFGRVDVASEWWFYEVEPVKSWRDGVRQVLAYSQQMSVALKPGLAVYGDMDWRTIAGIKRQTTGCTHCPWWGRSARPASDERIIAATQRPRKRPAPRWWLEQESRRLSEVVRMEERQYVIFGERELRRYKAPAPRTDWA